MLGVSGKIDVAEKMLLMLDVRVLSRLVAYASTCLVEDYAASSEKPSRGA